MLAKTGIVIDKEGFYMQKIRFLSGNALKIIAALAMLADHVGYLLFPELKILRIIGRLAFPIFAFMIAEGCKYTKNKIRYFSMIAGLAFICQVVYYVFDKSLYMCILVTFSLSIIALCARWNFKRIAFDGQSSLLQKLLAAWLFLACVVLIYVANLCVEMDYGFWGCMAPVFAGLFHMPKNCTCGALRRLDCNLVSVLMLGIGLVPLALSVGWVQPYSFLALMPLLLYSGKRGKLNMKYFFYIFYPVHLAVLQGIYMLMHM